jgi:hypothetical protein
MIPGVLELGTFTLNTLIGAWVTLSRNKAKAEAEAAERSERRMDRIIAATNAAREFALPEPEGEKHRVTSSEWRFGDWVWSSEKRKDWRGFIPKDGGLHSTRRVVIYIVIFAAFLAPVLAAFFGDNISIAYGYPETVRSLFFADNTEIKWLVLGSGERTLFIPPYVSLMVSAISGLLFGNQMAK